MPMLNPVRGRDAFEAYFRNQTDFATFATGNFVPVRFKSNSLRETTPQSSDPVFGYQLTNLRDESDVVFGQPAVGGDIVAGFDLAQIGWWLGWALGAPATTGAGPYVHTFTSGKTDLPVRSLSIRERTDGANETFGRYTGLACNTFALNISKEQDVQDVTLGMIGRSYLGKQSTHGGGTPAAELAWTRQNPRGWTVTVGGTSGVTYAAKGGSINYANNLEVQQILDGTDYIGGMEAGQGACTGTLVVRDVGDAMFDLAAARNALALVFTYSVSASLSLVITCPAATLTPMSRGFEGPGGKDVTFDWTARQTPSAPALTAVLTNAVSSYAMPA